MTPAGPSLTHPCLEAAAGVAPGEARLTDRQRLGPILEGAALVAHLDAVEGEVAAGWRGAVLTPEGLLRGVRARRRTKAPLPQRRMRELVRLLFRTDSQVAGRGAGRAAARRLLSAWEQSLTPVPGGEAVRQVFEAAPFLWQRGFGAARRSLAALQHGGEGGALRIAGPSSFAAAVRRRARSLREAQELLAGERAVRLWHGPAEAGDPGALAACGRWRDAVRAWGERPPASADERLEHGRALAALGRFQDALSAIKGLRRPSARVLRVCWLLQLGKLSAARRRLLRLESERLPPAELVAAAGAAVRLYGNLGQAGRAELWLERALRLRRPRLRLAAELLAAEAACERGDRRAAERHLQAARPAGEMRRLAWRWHQVQAMRARDAGEAAEAVAHMEAALAASGRAVSGPRAAELWNDLGLSRALAGDLGGAERAFRHCSRLLERAQGPRRTTSALLELAAVRLRRGRLSGVAQILERSRAEHRRAGNIRGLIRDQELWARYELVRGRPAAALAMVREGEARLDRRRFDWHRGELAVLAARALGWLGRPAAARAELASAPEPAFAILEAEEVPALWAQAGQRDRALASARGELAALWRAVLEGAEPPARRWQALEAIEPYRAARFVFDAETVAPGRAPVLWLRRAAGRLRRIGADPLAERLESREAGPWRALVRSLEGDGALEERLGGLFSGSGYPDVRLSWQGDGAAVVLVGGKGGAERLEAPLHGGRLVLAAGLLDTPLEALFAVARRLVPQGLAPPAGRGPARHGIVGESPRLRRCLERLAKLAPRDLPVLIHGETGTGKELMARFVHRSSGRARGPFLPVSCAELARELLPSELFGHARGAFTGADRDRAGIFETARRGTVFLDEIGDLPLAEQGRLLRVLQESEVRRVGESLARPVDVRVVAATHRALARMVEAGEFREDLYYRLRVGHVSLPPLRERGDDVQLLADHLLAALGPPVPRLTDGARRRLRGYRWPGNVRELKSTLEVAAAVSADGLIREEDLELPYASTPPRAGYHEMVRDYRKGLVLEALEAAGGNNAEAARRLSVSRQSLSYLRRQFDL